MIDFRYHLVSLVSVFLALAIGVVLGAGPLRESIGDTLTEQVDALRTDKSNLQEAVANRDLALDQRDAFVRAVGPELLEGTLTGAQVVVVALPDVDADAVTAVTDELGTAGASVVATATVGSAWTDEGSAQARAELGAQLAPTLDPAAGASEDPQEQLAAALAYALVAPSAASTATEDATAADGATTTDGATDGSTDGSTDGASDGAATPGGGAGGSAAANDVLAALTAADLVDVAGADGADAAQGRAVVVVAPAPSGTEDDAAVTAATETAEGSWDPLLTALDLRSSATVLAGPVAAGESPGLLAQVRSVDSDALAAVSVVDGTDDVSGLITTALALREQLSGGRGDYGTSSTAEAVVPASAATGAP